MKSEFLSEKGAVSTLALHQSKVETIARDQLPKSIFTSPETTEKFEKRPDALLNSVPRLFGTVFIDTLPTIALIDGGANINCIHSRILTQLDRLNFAYTIYPNNLGKIQTAERENCIL